MTSVFSLAILVELFFCLFVVVFPKKILRHQRVPEKEKVLQKLKANQQPEHGPLIGTQPKVEENQE